MNAEQAIEILLENQSGARARMLDHATSHPEYANIQLRDCEAFELAMQALREKQERKTGCSFCLCEEDDDEIYLTHGCDGSDLNVNNACLPINFCPYCGRKLEKEDSDA